MRLNGSAAQEASPETQTQNPRAAANKEERKTTSKKKKNQQTHHACSQRFQMLSAARSGSWLHTPHFIRVVRYASLRLGYLFTSPLRLAILHGARWVESDFGCATVFGAEIRNLQVALSDTVGKVDGSQHDAIRALRRPTGAPVLNK